MQLQIRAGFIRLIKNNSKVKIEIKRLGYKNIPGFFYVKIKMKKLLFNRE